MRYTPVFWGTFAYAGLRETRGNEWQDRLFVTGYAMSISPAWPQVLDFFGPAPVVGACAESGVVLNHRGTETQRRIQPRITRMARMKTTRKKGGLRGGAATLLFPLSFIIRAIRVIRGCSASPFFVFAQSAGRAGMPRQLVPAG